MYFKKTVFTLLFFIIPFISAKKEKNESFLKCNKGKIVLAISGSIAATACCGTLLYKCCDIPGWLRSLLSSFRFGWPSIAINVPKKDAIGSDQSTSASEAKKDDEVKAETLEQDKPQRSEREPHTEFERLAQVEGLDTHARL